MHTFIGVSFFLASSLSPEERIALRDLLETHGASAAPLEDATHVITHTPDFEGIGTVSDKAAIVTVRGLRCMSCTWSAHNSQEAVGRAFYSTGQGVTVRATFKLYRCLLQLYYSPGGYSPNPDKIFSGVVACAAEVCCAF
jgi:hypothetical protein